jgi:hypothetical protein
LKLTIRKHWEGRSIRLYSLADCSTELSRMFLTRCPRVIPVLWTIINTFVEERTREKFAILKTDELTEYIDEIDIPDFLAGQMQVRFLSTNGYHDR